MESFTIVCETVEFLHSVAIQLATLIVTVDFQTPDPFGEEIHMVVSRNHQHVDKQRVEDDFQIARNEFSEFTSDWMENTEVVENEDGSASFRGPLVGMGF